jgi:hypothetical protein
VRIREAFAEIGRAAPEPKGTIDSLALLTQKFGRRAGNMKVRLLLWLLLMMFVCFVLTFFMIDTRWQALQLILGLETKHIGKISYVF